MIQVGDIVKLKNPYKPSGLLHFQDFSRVLTPGATTAIERVRAWDSWKGFTYGIVFELLDYNYRGELRNVSLHLYDPMLLIIYMGANNIPTSVDFGVSEISLHKSASALG